MIPAKGAVVMPFITSQGGVVFVVPQGAQAIGKEHIIPLETFSAHDRDRWLYLDRRRDTGKGAFGWKWAVWFRPAGRRV